MNRPSAPEYIDAAIGRLAHRQHGYITHPQLLALGLGPHAIAYRIRTGALIRVHFGVYAVGHVPTHPLASSAAAVLACGPHAAMSHHSAAVPWQLIKRWDGLPEVTTPGKRRRPGIRVHRSITLTPADLTTYAGIRITSPARTLLDIAPTLREHQLIRAINDGRLAGHLTLPAIRELLSRSAGAPGAARLAELVADPALARSSFEDEFRRFIERHGLPQPLVNVTVEGYEVDALFPGERVIVELDGYRYHQDRFSFERDRDRDAAMLMAGYVTVRLTWERITQHPRDEADRLRRILLDRLARAS
jgi:REase_MTES_1575/Transcriptional regulator, AbiEi antitoxin